MTAFSVMRRGSEFVGPSVDPTIVVFDEVQFVIGEGLDTLTSVFTTPVGGLYLFMHGHQNGNNGLSVTEMRVNGAPTRYTRIDTIFESGSATALLLLSPGDQVYVHLTINEELYCTECYFDGVLLYQSL